MIYSLSTVETVELEISSYCNAACPQCPRNFFGGETLPYLPLRKWTLEDVRQIFPIDLLKQLKQVYFCGTYGDPLTNSRIVEICKFFKNNNNKIKIGIHTNGGVGSADVFKQLAPLVDFIAFGIDGLSDTNHLYRRHVKWAKVMNNARVFIQAGGRAIWDFIVFEHNQHQVDAAQQLSSDLGFKEFNIKKTSRFVNRSHALTNTLEVYDNKGFVEYTISVPTVDKYVNPGYESIANLSSADFKTYLSTCNIQCHSRKIKKLYIGADGFVFPCGWLHDRLYGPEVTNHADHQMIKDLMEEAGGWTKANAFYTPLQNIVDGAWFTVLEESWQRSARIERCAMLCGPKINVIGPQNIEISYIKT